MKSTLDVFTSLFAKLPARRLVGWLIWVLLSASMFASRVCAQSASISVSPTTVNLGDTVTVNETVTAASGDVLYSNYVWYRQPDGSTGLMMNTYADYIWQNSRSASGTITLNQAGTWQFYAYGYTGDAPHTQQVIESQPVVVTVNGPPATISVTPTSLQAGGTVTVTESVSAPAGDVLYSNYAWFQRPDSTTGIVMSTYTDYYWQNSRTATGTMTVNQAGTWQFYAYGYTGDAPHTQQVIQSSAFAVTVTDTTPPSVPTGLSASNITGSSFTLNWSASTDNASVASYEVALNGGSLGTTTSTSMAVTGLTLNTTYAMTVRARDPSNNQSSWSNALNVTTAGDTQPPTAPTSLQGTLPSSTSAALTWSASTDNVGVTGYAVYRNGTQVGTTTSLSFTDSGLSAGTTYTYTVKAYDAASNYSSASNSVNLTTPSQQDVLLGLDPNSSTTTVSPTQLQLNVHQPNP